LPTFQLTAALNELEESALIGREGESVACRHELIAAAAEQTLQPSALTLLLRQAAHLLERDALSSGNPALLWQSARHWEAAERFDDMRRVLEELAEYLLLIGSAQEASQALERALQHSSSDEDQSRILGRALTAYRVAGDWRAIAATVARRRELGVRSEDQSVDDEKLLLEAMFRSSAAYDDVLALIIDSLKHDGLEPNRRVILAQRGIIVALNALDRAAATRIYSTLDHLQTSEFQRDRDFLAARLIYETSCGSLDEALRVSELLRSADIDPNVVDVAELQRIRWSTVPLRYVGAFQTAASVLEEVYRGAKGRRWTEAFEACTELTTVYIAASEPATAELWQGRALESLGHVCQDSAASLYYANEVRLALCAEDGARAVLAMEQLLPIYASSKGTGRVRADCLGLKVATCIMRGESPLQNEVVELRNLLKNSLELAGHDISVCALAAALGAGQQFERDELLAHYRTSRRETHAIPAYLTRLMGAGSALGT
jgi:tetratricopeptide (TPR) repeat protein